MQDINDIQNIVKDKEKLLKFSEYFINRITNEEHYNIHTFKYYCNIMESSMNITRDEEYLIYSAYVESVFNQYICKFNNVEQIDNYKSIEDLARMLLIATYFKDSLITHDNNTDFIDLFVKRAYALNDFIKVNETYEQRSNLINRYFKVMVIIHDRFEKNRRQPYNFTNDLLNKDIKQFISIAISFIKYCLEDAKRSVKENEKNGLYDDDD